MNVLLVSGHPAQVHNFRNIKFGLENKGHKVYWLATDKDISRYLLEHYQIQHGLLCRPSAKTWLSKLKSLILNFRNASQFIRKHQIDLVVSRVSPYVTLPAFFHNKAHIVLTDTETAGIYDKIFGGIASSLLTAKSFQRTLRSDQIRFSGNIELFYLHPNHFSSMTRAEVAKLLNIGCDEQYVIMRFVSWDAYHDKGLSGFTNENKIKAVKAFSKHARVFISGENQLPPELEEYRIKIHPEKMHNVLAHAKMFFGESATMASESAMLGRPAVYSDKIGRGYTDEEGEYGLVFNFNNTPDGQLNAIEKGVDVLTDSCIEAAFKENHRLFMKDKIDVTAFMVWFIENYPESAKIMKENPDYQNRFK